MEIIYNEFFAKYFNNVSWRTTKFATYFVKNNLKAGNMILDIGAGPCQYKNLFTQNKIKYIAVDYFKYCEDIDIISDAMAVPFKNGQFDAIMSIQVLEHLKEPDLFFKECCRVLKEKGKLFLTANMAYKIHMEPNNYFFFTKYGLKYLAEKNNFKVISIEPHGGAFQVFSKSFLFLLQSLRSRGRFLYYLSILIFFLPLAMVTLICTILDFLDKDKLFTLNYECYFQKL